MPSSGGQLWKLSLAEFGCDARSLAGYRESYCVGETWRGHAVSGDWVALGSRSCFLGVSQQAYFQRSVWTPPHYHYHYPEEHFLLDTFETVNRYIYLDLERKKHLSGFRHTYDRTIFYVVAIRVIYGFFSQKSTRAIFLPSTYFIICCKSLEHFLVCSLCQTIWTRGLPARDSSSITGLVLDKPFP